MVDDEWVAGLDGDAACAALVAAHADLLEVECRQLVLAGVDRPARPGRRAGRRPGEGLRARAGVAEDGRVVACGADGIPLIGEFACAEFAALQDLHPLAGRARAGQGRQPAAAAPEAVGPGAPR